MYAINESVLPVPLFWLVELIVALPLDEVALELLPMPALTLGLTVKLLVIPTAPTKPKALPWACAEKPVLLVSDVLAVMLID